MSGSLEEKAEGGDLEAQCNLALLFEIGLDRQQDMEEALKWWEKAAQKGHPFAIKKIALLKGESQAEHEVISEKSPSHEGLRIQTKVLVIEDDEGLRITLRDFLKHHGLAVIDVANGTEGVQALMSNPDTKIIITDLKMPVMNGMQFLKTMRKMQLAAGAKIVVMTAFSKPELIAKGKSLAVDHWLAKPFHMEKLLGILDKAAPQALIQN